MVIGSSYAGVSGHVPKRSKMANVHNDFHTSLMKPSPSPCPSSSKAICTVHFPPGLRKVFPSSILKSFL